MNERECVPTQNFSIAAVERDTGLSKDTLRVWERRYGFPRPGRDSAGDRVYPPDQVERLRLIHRLMEAGHRPGRIVALEPEALQALSAPAAAPERPSEPNSAPALDVYLELIQHHDAHKLRSLLGQTALRLGLVNFVTLVVAPLNTAVGEAWLNGRFQVFEEHIYTECVKGVLRNVIASIPAPQGVDAPRVLLTSFPDEPHGLGLLMAEALFALEGCNCLPLGPQTPISDIAKAARAYKADIVALSFTAVLGANVIVAGLRELRRQLPQGMAIWVGGRNPVLSRREVPGVLPVQTLESLREQVARWRSQTLDVAADVDKA
ncbi:MerR family transcriptional regulator [Polaromonas naphthalenivorans]|uniref:Putative transcriptional regulator, MerR family n=1 Tax=Polaromonas naphthalenivorans (strain CJ2) TaxID=365044 RepID=A1VM84_POLNA|nr:MerR family transcriptional regulator [Polaromonas naphthalenivorans]ABM36762.1 putative transcriptional regulator, MerR family [Polaromonas naphthalenivorans CJ2]